MTTIKALTKDNHIVIIPIELAEKIPLFKDMCNLCTPGDESIHLSNIDKETLDDVLSSLSALNEGNLGDIIDDIAKTSILRLMNLANAANFFQLDQIVDAVCLWSIDQFDTMSVEQMEKHPILRH